MGLWDAITGRSRAPQPDLDALFAVPSAAIALETELGLRPTGTGSVCFRAPAGAAYADTQADVVALLGTADAAPEVTTSRDSYGYTWLVIEGDPADTDGLCTGLHAVNTTLADQGFATGLLCTVVVFADSAAAPRRAGLPLQAVDLLPLRPGPRHERRRVARRPAGSRQPARALGARRPHRRAAARAAT